MWCLIIKLIQPWGESIRNIIIEGPFKYLHVNDQFPYPFINHNLWNPYPFTYCTWGLRKVPFRAEPSHIGHYRGYPHQGAYQVSIKKFVDWVFIKMSIECWSRCPMSVDWQLIKGINQHLTADAFSTHCPYNPASLIVAWLEIFIAFFSFCSHEFWNFGTNVFKLTYQQGHLWT